MTKAHRLQLLMVVLLVVLVAVFYILLNSRPVAKELRVVFLDVGQGDAIFIESPSGTQVLIDGGPDQSVLRALGAQLRYFDRDLDLLIATHPDQDHIGGLVDVFRRYEVTTLARTENTSETPVANAFTEAVIAEGSETIIARRGQVFDLGWGPAGSTTLHILFPDRDAQNLESNTSSIVAQLRYGQTEFLFTGDAPDSIEEYLVMLDGMTLQSEVLKAGHHGSKTSSSAKFVATVQPQYAIISAGKDNRYGHPHADVIEILTTAGAIIKNTAQSGSISCLSDGVKVRC